MRPRAVADKEFRSLSWATVLSLACANCPFDFVAAIDTVRATSREEVSRRGRIETREQFASVVHIASDEARVAADHYIIYDFASRSSVEFGEAGCDLHLAKPFRRMELVQLLAEQLDKPADPPSQEAESGFRRLARACP